MSNLQKRKPNSQPESGRPACRSYRLGEVSLQARSHAKGRDKCGDPKSCSVHPSARAGPLNRLNVLEQTAPARCSPGWTRLCTTESGRKLSPTRTPGTTRKRRGRRLPASYLQGTPHSPHHTAAGNDSSDQRGPHTPSASGDKVTSGGAAPVPRGAGTQRERAPVPRVRGAADLRAGLRSGCRDPGIRERGIGTGAGT